MTFAPLITSISAILATVGDSNKVFMGMSTLNFFVIRAMILESNDGTEPLPTLASR